MEDKELMREFISESTEMLDQAEPHLLAIQNALATGNPVDNDAVNAVFRVFHSLKGNAGFLSFQNIASVTHEAETLLDLLRKDGTAIGPDKVETLLETCDFVRALLAHVRKTGADDVHAEEAGRLAARLAAPGQEPDAPATSSAKSRGEEDAKPPESVPMGGALPPEPKSWKTTTQVTRKELRRSLAGETIRVDVPKLDQLSNLVGELVIAEATVTHHPGLADIHLEGFQSAAHQLDRITEDLQDLAMTLRMIPITGVFRRMIRLVHDLARKGGKKIDLVLAGEETEVDKNAVELLADPLVHMIRNAVDHGIEMPVERRAAGKPETGHMILEAHHQASEIWITLTDDGRGLNREKILAKATALGLVRGDSAQMSDADVHELVFAPGFSTADTVTDISGRGVGLDVVKRNIERIRGRLDISSTEGNGSTFTVRIPLTLAIIQGMIVRVGPETYIVPMHAIRESFRPEADTLSTVTGRGEIITVRGEVFPLFRLATLFGIPDAVFDPTQSIVMLIEDGRRRAAIVLDELLGQQKIVVKGLGEALSEARGVAGATILSNGRVGLILDVAEIVRLATETA